MTAPRSFTAALLAMAAMAIVSLVDNFVAEMSRSHGLWQFHVIRALTAVPILVAVALLTRQRLRPLRPVRLVVRSSAIAIGLVIYFSVLGALPVAQAGAGLFSAPIWVLILSALLFGQSITLGTALAILTGFAGVLMLLQPDPTDLTLLSLVPMGAGMFYGLGSLLTRYWCAEEPMMALAIGVFVMLGIISLGALAGLSLWPVGGDPDFLTRGWEPLTGDFMTLALVQTLGAVFAMPLVAQAYRIGTPSYVSVFEYSFLIFAALWGLLLWGQTTDALAWGGIAVIIVSGIAMTVLQKREG